MVLLIQESTGLSVYQSPRANALTIAKGVKKEMAKLEKSFPKDLIEYQH